VPIVSDPAVVFSRFLHVVPAKARTNRTPRFGARYRPRHPIDGLRGIGSGVRRDDGETFLIAGSWASCIGCARRTCLARALR